MSSRSADTTRRLWLIRHAEPAAAAASGRDRDRPLTRQGEADARRLGSWLAERLAAGPAECWVVSSDARRAAATARWLHEALGQCEETLPRLEDPRLYGAASDTLLEVIRETPPQCRTLALIAHNPGISELANALSREATLPPLAAGAMVAFELYADWPEIGPGKVVLERTLSPAELR